MGAKAIAAAKEEKERLANHPLADELFANQKRLKALEELVKQYPNDKEIKNSYIIVKGIVNELIGFPTSFLHKRQGQLPLKMLSLQKMPRIVCKQHCNLVQKLNNCNIFSYRLYYRRYAGLAQLVEHFTCNEDVAGSIPASGSMDKRTVYEYAYEVLSSAQRSEAKGYHFGSAKVIWSNADGIEVATAYKGTKCMVVLNVETNKLDQFTDLHNYTTIKSRNPGKTVVHITRSPAAILVQRGKVVPSN